MILDNEKDHSQEIDLKLLFKVLWDKKVFISALSSIFAILSIIYALLLPNYFTSQSTLYAVIDEGDTGSTLSSMASRYGGLAGVAGITLPQVDGASKTAIMLATIESREFLSHLLTFEGVREKLIATKSYNTSSKTISFDKNIFNSESNTWVDGQPSDLFTYNAYKQIISLYEDKISGLITISVTHKSPIFAKSFLDLIIQEANNIMRQRDMIESSDSLEYLTNQLDSTKQADIRYSINQLIETQLKKQMLANVRKFYILNPIDIPFIPEEKSEPKRSELVIMLTIIGFIFSILIVLFRHYSEILKE
tara:strand:+ start:2173 stop:3093 length:921 start_codon:yes stop_codon:yes gene_type:complete